MKKTLRGFGLTIELDTEQVFSDNPGEGTPAIVRCGNASSTYWCAIDTGELLSDTGSDSAVLLSTAQSRWLAAQDAAVDAFLFAEKD